MVLAVNEHVMVLHAQRCRYLGMHLAEYKAKQDGQGWLGKNSKCGWLTSTQLCPIIWLLALWLMSTYTYKVGASLG